MEQHERSIDRIVKKWRSVTEQYADIFQSLADTTAAHTSILQTKKHRHAELVAMARTAIDAREIASNFLLYEDLRKAEGGTAAANDKESGEGGSGSSSSTSESGESEEQFLRPKRAGNWVGQPRRKQFSDRVEHGSNGRKILQDRDAQKPNDPQDTLAGSERKAEKAKKAGKRREKKQAKRAADRTKSHPPTENGSHPNIVPQVEYEDVSAEVDARLKEKEEKRAAAKKEKKRKRESGDSIEVVDQDVKPEKPQKKRAKAEGDVEVNGAGKKKHERDEADHLEDEDRKKRKKLKGSSG